MPEALPRKPVQPPSLSPRARSGFVSRLRSIGQVTNTWLQITAIVIAGIWAIGIFYFDNVVAPRRRPAHLNVMLDLEKAGTKNGQLAVQMRISAENASSRTVYLLPAIYRFWGISNNGKALDEASFEKAAQESVLQNKDEMVSRYGPETQRALIAVGRVFTDWHLNPGEQAVRTAVIHVPQDAYDTLLSTLSLPISHQESGLSIEWNPLEIGKSKLYHHRGKAEEDQGDLIDWSNPGFRDQTGFAFATARAVLSLWESEPGQPLKP